MNRLFPYIEDHLPYDLDTALLSKNGYVSHTQLYRDFYSLTGHSVKEYVRKRRLSKALALIKLSGFGLADIAYQCGYSSHQALCRAVKHHLGLSPTEYRNGDVYYFFPPYEAGPVQAVTVSNATIPRALRVLFYRSSPNGIERAAVSAFLTAFPGYKQRIFGRNGKQQGNRFCYELYLTDIENEYASLAERGFALGQETPAVSAFFASCTVVDDEPRICAAWDYLYGEWLQRSMFAYTNEPFYEEYLLKSGRPVKLRLYLPIKKRTGETRITCIHQPGLRFVTAKAAGPDAERTASQAVMDYLMARDPQTARTATAFYVQHGAGYCVCGIQLPDGWRAVNAEGMGNIKLLELSQGDYWVLESRVMGDYERYAGLLRAFAADHGFSVSQEGLFAVYDAAEGFENPAIRMYCPIKL